MCFFGALSAFLVNPSWSREDRHLYMDNSSKQSRWINSTTCKELKHVFSDFGVNFPFITQRSDLHQSFSLSPHVMKTRYIFPKMMNLCFDLINPEVLGASAATECFRYQSRSHHVLLHSRPKLTNRPVALGRNSESIIAAVRVILHVKLIKLQENTVTWRDTDAPHTQPEDTQRLKTSRGTVTHRLLLFIA